MLTEEQYKKEAIRMWDTLRFKDYQGNDHCIGVSCAKCPLNGSCSSISAFEQIEIVEKWSKEHPVKKELRFKYFDSFGEALQWAGVHVKTSDIRYVLHLEGEEKWKVAYMCAMNE